MPREVVSRAAAGGYAADVEAAGVIIQNVEHIEINMPVSGSGLRDPNEHRRVVTTPSASSI